LLHGDHKLYSCCKPMPVLNTNGEYVHLGHIASANLDDKNDILSKRNSLCGKMNNVLCYFGNVIFLLSLNYNLLRAYCSDFYGCVRWDISNSAIEDVCIAWRKSLRRVWDLPASTHTRLITPLGGLLQLKVELASRCVKFMGNCLSTF